MIYADIKGKTHVPEDVLTSNCIELLSLLPDSYLIEFFSMSVDHKGRNIDLTEYCEVKKLDFWPWLRGGGEPDILCLLRNNKTNKHVALIIEVKHGAGKSSYAHNDISHPTEITISNDQLAKYWQAANNQYEHDVVVIYLTHHHHFPKTDIENSINETNQKAQIYWVSWYHYYQFIVDKYKQFKCDEIERKILGKLKIYLEEKGYTRFLSWNKILVPVRLLYHRSYNIPVNDPVCGTYDRLYRIHTESNGTDLLHFNREYWLDINFKHQATRLYSRYRGESI